MKKFLILALITVIAGSIILKNAPVWLLKIMAIESGSNPNVLAASATSGPKPPYKDGTYLGNTADAFYGTIQVQAIITGGKITDIQFLQYPNDRTRSIAINTLAMPNLKQEAIQSQSSNIDIVSGATDSSQAFMQSLASALTKAK